MARGSMTALIGQVRQLIGDTAATPQFSDDQVQDALDDHAVVEPRFALRAVTDATGVTLRYVAAVGQWETATLLDDKNEVVVPATADLRRGVWTFAADRPGPLFVAGTRYDIYGAAVVLLRLWQAALKDVVDFSADGASFKVSQRLAQMERLIDRYAALALGGVFMAQMVRSELVARGW